MIRPLITEKTMVLAQRGWYTFAVKKLSRKEAIAKEVQALYSVTVKDIRTIKKVGKNRRVGRRGIAVKQSDWKKAMVKLAKGQTIPVFEVPTEQAKA